MNLASLYLDSAVKRMDSCRELGSKTLDQLGDADMGFQPDAHSNSISTIIRHMHGNMLSRFTNFLTEDGEKSWRDRDGEFSGPPLPKADLLQLWEEGWTCTLDAIRGLKEADLEGSITIRSESLPVVDAINRQLGHYAYHTGQIVYLGKMIRSGNWETLSVPLGKSQEFNASMEKQFGRKP